MNGPDSFDLGGAGALPAAVDWIARILTGQVATALAVLAVAGLGYTLLSGRVPVRRAGAVLLGCFVVLGASTIANALLIGTRDKARDSQGSIVQQPIAVTSDVGGYDPYAFASTPTATDRVTDPFSR